MKTNKNLLIVTAAILCCAVTAWFATSIQGGERTYEVEPQVTIPEYRTDTARAIDAYEYLMDRFIDITEKNLDGINATVFDITRKLDSIDESLQKLSERIERIEDALGIQQSETRTGNDSKTKLPCSKTHKKTEK